MSTPDKLQEPESVRTTMPRAFGDFLLLHRLGRGGMGEVFLAKSGGLAGIEKLCVVKTLRGDLTADTEYKQRFIDEARVVVQLNHRNICHVFDVGRVNRAYYLAMEYVRGRDLRTILKRAYDLGVPVPQDVMLYLVSEVLEALDYAHRLKDPISGEPLHLIHRDVSPQNVMVNYEGEVKLIDFGLAQSTMKIERTAPRIVMGKLAYMPPEQARGHSVDARVDQFSVGVIAYEAVTGRGFYEGKSADEVWRMAGHGGHRPDFFQSLEPPLRDILERSLSVDPDQRFATCADMRQELLRLNVTRGSMAGARELRALMEKLFADEEQQDRALLQKFSNVKPLDPRPRGEEEAKPKEATVRIATAIVKRSDVGLDAGEADKPRSEKTLVVASDTETGSAPALDAPNAPERTELVSRVAAGARVDGGSAKVGSTMDRDDEATELVADRGERAEATVVVRDRIPTDAGVVALRPKRRGPLVVAAGALAVALAAGAFWALSGEPPQDPDDAPSVRVVTKPPPPPPVNAAPAPAPVAEPAEEPAAMEPSAVAEAPPAPAEVDEPAKTAPPRRRRATRRLPKPPDAPLLTHLQRIQYLDKHCRKRAACASRYVARNKDIRTMPPKEIGVFQQQVTRCVAQCRR